MVSKKRKETKRIYIAVLMCLVFAGCLAVLSFIHYSDGDDTYFLQNCTTMNLPEYLKWRYETWTGRMVSEGLTHIFFNSNLWMWRIVNAGMLTVLPIILVLLKNEISGKNKWMSICIALLFYLLIDIRTFGYSCIWITGSMNYLWPVVCGLLALLSVAKVAFQPIDEKNKHKKIWIYTISTLCALIAAMSSEQMAAVLLAFELIYIGVEITKKRMPQKGIVIQTVVTVTAFLISATAPGNALRTAESVEVYMPQFELLSIGERGFLLGQWLVSSFANENVMLLVAIWLIGIFMLRAERMEKNKKVSFGTTGCITGCVVFLITAVAGKFGVGSICDMGIRLADMTGKVEAVPTASDMTGTQWFAFLWWSLALLFTFILLWKLTGKNAVVILTYLGAIACEVIMIFSPTIYSSGERVFFATGIMLMVIILLLLDEIAVKKYRLGCIGCILLLALANLVIQIPELMGMITG